MADTWLYLDTPTMKGPAVRRWQEVLLALGYDLGELGANGDFGEVTDKATRDFQQKHGLKDDGIVGPKTLRMAETELGGKQSSSSGVIKTTVDGVEIIDYRTANIPPPSNTYGTRSWSDITGVMLHRTGGVLGEDPTRWLTINAHVGVTLGGVIILMHDWTRYIAHGNNPSPWTVGIEIDGNPEGSPCYWWRPGGGPHEITDAQVKASVVLIDLLLREFQQHGQELKYIVAHRQADQDRECDPGWQAWQKIAIPWLEKTGAHSGPREGRQPTAGLKVPVGYAGDTWGSGKQIPREWDSRSTIPFWT